MKFKISISDSLGDLRYEGLRFSPVGSDCIDICLRISGVDFDALISRALEISTLSSVEKVAK